MNEASSQELGNESAGESRKKQLSELLAEAMKNPGAARCMELYHAYRDVYLKALPFLTADKKRPRSYASSHS